MNSPKKDCSKVTEPWIQILGIDARSINRHDIKNAWRKAAMKAHPDKGGSHNKMLLVNESYTKALEWYERTAPLTKNNEADEYDIYSHRGEKTSFSHGSSGQFFNYTQSKSSQTTNTKNKFSSSRNAEQIFPELNEAKETWTKYKIWAWPAVAGYLALTPLYIEYPPLAIASFCGIMFFAKKYWEAKWRLALALEYYSKTTRG